MANEEHIEKVEEREQNSFSISVFCRLLLSHWYWFVIALIIALVVAVLQILHTTPLYTRQTSLLIKDDPGKSSISREFEDFGFTVGSSSNISNEIQSLTAVVLMQETAKRLQLDMEQRIEEGLHTHVLYKDSPVLITRGGNITDESFFTFKMKMESPHKLVVYDINENSDKRIIVPLSTNVKLPVGTLRFDLSPNFTDEWIGREIQVEKSPISAVGSLYATRLNVGLTDKESTVLQLSLIDEVPLRAEDILRTLIDVYNDNWVQDKNKVAESTTQFITERLSTLTKELGDVEKDISDYKSQNLLPDVQAATGMYMTRSSQNYNTRLDLNNQLSMARYVETYLRQKSSDSQLLPANTLGGNGVDRLIDSYNQLMAQRTTLVDNSSENSPVVKELDVQLKAQRQAIQRSLSNMIAQIEAQISNLEQSEGETNSKIAANPKQARQLLSIERQQKVKESLYIYLLQKREESELSKAYTAWNTRIIQPPHGSPYPTSPQRKNILLVAIAIGLILPAGLLYLREKLNSKVRSRKDIEGVSLPFIGEIPSLENKKKWWSMKKSTPRSIVVEQGNHNIVNEAFRMARTNLDFLLAEQENQKVVMVTSFNPGSGKTIITANLAKTIALKGGERVLAVDLDLRCCALSMMYGHPLKEGISSFLAGQKQMEEIIVPHAFGEGIDLLPVGILPPNPTELLLLPKMDELMAYARKNYDYVLIDCPPIEVVADASIIRKYADATLFIVRAGLMERSMVNDIEKLYREQKYNHMALMLNGTELSSGRYGYLSGSRYGSKYYSYYTRRS